MRVPHVLRKRGLKVVCDFAAKHIQMNAHFFIIGIYDTTRNSVCIDKFIL